MLPAERLPCRKTLARDATGRLDPVAEGVGFEPTVPMRHNGFRDRPIRPLSHPSGEEPSRCAVNQQMGEREMAPFFP